MFNLGFLYDSLILGATISALCFGYFLTKTFSSRLTFTPSSKYRNLQLLRSWVLSLWGGLLAVSSYAFYNGFFGFGDIALSLQLSNRGYVKTALAGLVEPPQVLVGVERYNVLQYSDTTALLTNGYQTTVLPLNELSLVNGSFTYAASTVTMWVTGILVVSLLTFGFLSYFLSILLQNERSKSKKKGK